jgi:hypothetical protein
MKMKKYVLWCVVLVFALSLLFPAISIAANKYVFAWIPKALNNPVFELGRSGALQRAKELTEETGDTVEVLYVASVNSDAAEQVRVIEDVKSIENYQLQYSALKEKIYEFPETLFIVWTGAAQVRGATTKENAQRAQKFFKWVKEEWDQPGDNIYIWDFFQLETEGGFYLKNQYAASSDDSHPNYEFAERVAPLLVQRIVDVIEGRGDEGSLTGE